MKVLLLLTKSNAEYDKIRELLSRINSISHIFIATTNSDVRYIGNSIAKPLSKLYKIDLVVLDNANIEEKSMKIYVSIAPDIVVDCDKENILYAVKSLLENAVLDRIRCGELK
ncbi:MAG: hypothetical protein ABWW65_03270 [Thermoprotei archaeon]